MRIVRYNDKNSIELRWSWMPYWLAVSPIFISEIESLVRDVIILNGVTGGDDLLERLENFVHQRIAERFEIPGLVDYLQGLRYLPE